MNDSIKKGLKLQEICSAIRHLTELLGYARGQRDAYTQLDFEEKEKYRDMFTLREMTEGLQTALRELMFKRISLEQELNKNE